MKKLFSVVFVILLCGFVLLPSNINAFSVKDSISNIYLLDDKNTSPDIGNLTDGYNQEQTCSGGNSILGDPNDENSVAWLLQQILNFIKVVGPMLVVVLSSIDFAKVIVKSDDEAMAKAQKKLGMRLILAALLFFIPTLVQVILDVFGLTAESTCGLQ